MLNAVPTKAKSRESSGGGGETSPWDTLSISLAGSDGIRVNVDGTREGRSVHPWRLAPAFVRDYKFADYFERKVLQKRPYLRREWCIAVVESPRDRNRKETLRFRFWAPIPELGGRYLRVITLADKVTILNAFPDRGFKP